jgi:acetolactate synthase I/II/III large subunit
MNGLCGGDLVAQYLREVEGVTTVFSLAGGHIARIYDGMLKYGIRLVDVRHEQAAAMMAQAWSVFSHRPGVCLVTPGPGYTNALTGIVNAAFDGAPLVILCGTAPMRDWDRGALQEMNHASMIASVVKWTGVCYSARRIPEYLAKAFRCASSGRPGPVLLEFPPEILHAPIAAETPVPMGKRAVIHKPAADPEAAQHAAEFINGAERPLVIGGSGVGFSDCGNALSDFLAKTGIPFQLFNHGRGVVSDDHPLSLAAGGFLASHTALARADVVIVLGLRLNWMQRYGKSFPQAKAVRVDIEPTEIDRNRPADVGLVGDLCLVLKQLTPLLRAREHGGWLREVRSASEPLLRDEMRIRETPSYPIHPARLVEVVKRTLPDAIAIVDGGDTSYFGSVGLAAREKGAVVIAAGGLFGCIGTGIPYAIAAKLARPEKTVVLINGDGSFGLNAMEFHTAVRHKAPFLCIINNDQAWGLIKHGQERAFGEERVVATDLGVVHYEKIVEALGGYGEFVTRDDELVPALERAIASGLPACVNVLTDATVASPMAALFFDSLDPGRDA